MVKKHAAQKGWPTPKALTHDQRVDALDRAISKAIDECEALDGLGEKEWCETVLDALDVHSEGRRMRLREIDDEDD